MALTECVECGGKVSTKAETCPHCGRVLEPQLPRSSDGEMTPIYAGFWVRVGAVVTDGVCGFVTSAVISLFLIWVMPDVLLDNPEGVGSVLGLTLVPLYFAFMESSSKQATLGKMALGLKVTDLNGERIGFGKAILRFFAKFISGLPVYFGFFMVGFDEKKQSLHDKIVGTLVLKTSSVPDVEHQVETPVAEGSDAELSVTRKLQGLINKRNLQGTVLLVGLIGAILAYTITETTSRPDPNLSDEMQTVLIRLGGCDSPLLTDDMFDLCRPNYSGAIARGGIIALLAVLAFAGVTVMYKDED